MRIQLDISIPMRDGVRLYGALYRPDAGKRFPVLLIRSPYSTQHPRYVEWARRFVAEGYAVLMQDSRGRYESEDEWRPYVDERDDGYDTQQWIGQQPWCDGTIGTFGVSYPGFTQILPAPLRSPFVKALVPIANQEDNYGHMRYNGVLQLQNAMNFIWLGQRTNQNAPRDLIDWDQVYRRLPLLTALDDLGERPFYREIIRHPCFDEFWASYSMKGQYGEVETPAYFITGWYDNLLHEGFKCFKGWRQQARGREAREQSRLMVGPWTHTLIGSDDPFGDVDFGPAARVDMPQAHLRWYDQRLKGIDSGIDREAPVQLFVMGENVWRGEEAWPLERTQYTRFFLHSGGQANSMHGDGRLSRQEPEDEPCDSYTYDPDDPVPTLGGQSMFIDNTGTQGPPASGAARRRAGLHHRAADRGRGSYRAGGTGAARSLQRGRDRLYRHPSRRAPRGQGHPLVRGHCADLLPRLLPRPQSHRTRSGVRLSDRAVEDQQSLPGRALHPAGGLQQQFPAL